MRDGEVPFCGSRAVRVGAVGRWQLGREFERVHPDVYVPVGAVLDARGRALAAAEWAKGDAVLVGFSAAALHGTRWLDNRPAEIVLPRRARPQAGLRVYRDVIPDDEVCWIDGFRCTTPARTGYDLGRRLEFDDAVAVLDALCHRTGLKPDRIAAVAERYHGARGTARLRRVLPFVDPGAESIPETRTRLLLVRAGLPTPETQIPIYRDGRLFARLDMGWRTHKVAVEYDGAHHWTDATQRAWDIDREATLKSLGWTLIRASTLHLTRHPQPLLTRIRQALARSASGT